MSQITLEKEALVALMDEVASKAAEKAVEAKMKEVEPALARLNKFAPKGGVSAKSDEELAKLSKKQKSAEFIKAVYNKDTASITALSQKSLTEGVGSAGGFLVPEEFGTEVFRLVQDFGLIAKLGRIFPMNHDTLNVPRMASTVSVYWPGEAVAGTPSYPVFERVQLIAKSLVGITPMANELLADANVDIVDFLLEIFAEAIAGEIDNQGFAGTGSPWTGILNASGTNVYQPANGSGYSTFTGAATPDNARQLISKVIPWALQGAAFIMHRTVWALFQTVKTSGSGEYFISAATPALTNPNAAQGFPLAMAGTLWGYPVYLSDKMPSTTAVSTNFVIFGSLRHFYVGQRAELSVAISQDATVGTDNLFAANMSAVRVITRMAGSVGLPGAFSILKTAAS